MDEYIDELMRIVTETAVYPNEDELYRALTRTFKENTMMVLSTPQCTPTFRKKPEPAFRPILYNSEPDLNRELSLNLLKERMVSEHSNMIQELLDEYKAPSDRQMFVFDSLYNMKSETSQMSFGNRGGMSFSTKQWFEPLVVNPQTKWPSVGTIGHIDHRKLPESTLTRILRMRNGNYEPKSCASSLYKKEF